MILSAVPSFQDVKNIIVQSNLMNKIILLSETNTWQMLAEQGDMSKYEDEFTGQTNITSQIFTFM